MLDVGAILATAKPSNSVAERVVSITNLMAGKDAVYLLCANADRITPPTIDAVARNASRGRPDTLAMAREIGSTLDRLLTMPPFEVDAGGADLDAASESVAAAPAAANNNNGSSELSTTNSAAPPTPTSGPPRSGAQLEPPSSESNNELSNSGERGWIVVLRAAFVQRILILICFIFVFLFRFVVVVVIAKKKKNQLL